MVGVKNVVWGADAFLVMTSDAVLSRVLPPVVSATKSAIAAMLRELAR
jgi:hypothetical protein